MGRRNVARQQEAVFAQENPTQVEETTRIEVARDSGRRYVLETTEQGEEPVQSEVPDTNLKFWQGPIEGGIPDLLTIDRDVEGPNFELGGSVTYYNWRGQEREKDASLALSDLGIGVASGGDVIGVVVDAFKGELDEESLQSFAAAGPNETLKLGIEDEDNDGSSNRELDFLEHGGKSIGIDFDILSGEGTVQVVLIDDETGIERTFEFGTEIEVAAAGGRGRAGATETEIRERLEAEMGDGLTFENVEIRTTGDLEIAVTGIDFTTGHVDGFLLP